MNRVERKLINNYWLGSEEIFIFYSFGTFSVWSAWDDENPLFIGHYEQCVDYVNNAIADYLESTF